jgi:circadian clock protein KaiB
METIELTLFVAGTGARARNAREQVERLCRDHLGGRARLSVVDLLAQADLARERGVFLAPTLIKESPLPCRRAFGDLRDAAEVLWALDVEPAS